MTAQEHHAKVLQETAEAYRSRGFEVHVEPVTQEVPEFLAELQPDLVAVKNEEKVVVEVKERKALQTTEQVRRIADAVKTQPGWRFELVLYSAGKPGLDAESAPLALDEVQAYLETAKAMHRTEQMPLAFLTAWIAAEAVLRQLAARYEVSTEILSPRKLLKELHFTGALSLEQYELLLKGAALRDRIVHGFRGVTVGREQIDALDAAVRTLLREVAQADLSA